jgi:hypothetical protein
VKNDEKNNHAGSNPWRFRGRSFEFWCGGGDLNPYALRR